LILNQERKRAEKRNDIAKSIQILQNKKFDIFSVKSQVYDNIRVQGGLNTVEAEQANSMQIKALQEDYKRIEEATKEYTWLLSSPTIDSLDKMILNYYYFEGLTHRGIAVIQDCSHTNVKRNLEKAIRKLSSA